MRTIRRLAILWRNLFRRSRVERDLEDELRAYVEMAIEENCRAGMTAADARRAALMEVGAVDAVKEGVRDIRAGAAIEQLAQDLSYGLRMLRKNPGFTIVAVGSLALGIGATTAIYSLMDAIFVRPLPLADVERLVRIVEKPHPPSNGHTWPEYVAYRDQGASVLSASAAFGDLGTVHARDGDETFLTDVLPVSGDYFPTLGLSTTVGRLFTPADDRHSGGHPVAVLSHSFWRRRFIARRDVLGRTLTLNGTAFTIVGVAPRGFRGLDLRVDPAIFVPTAMGWAMNLQSPGRPLPDVYSPHHNWLVLIGRLRDGVDPREAAAALTTIARRLPARFDRPVPDAVALEPAALTVVPGSGYGNLWQFTFMLLAVATSCLLIASSNVAGLLLARAVDRRKEIGLRLALGATSRRIVQQLMTEGALLAAMAGAAGLAISAAAFHAFGGFSLPGNVSIEALALGLNGRLLLIATLVSVLTAVFFSLVPAWQARALDLRAALTARNGRHGWRPSLLRGALVTGQMALCLPLLVGAGLLLRSLHNAMSVDLGFQTTGVLTLELPGAPAAQGASLIERLAERARHLLGTDAADLSSSWAGHSASTFYVDGTRRNVDAAVTMHFVGPEYFNVLRIPVRRGRVINHDDVRGAPKVAVVNESFARLLWPRQNPIGRTTRWLGWLRAPWGSRAAGRWSPRCSR